MTAPARAGTTASRTGTTTEREPAPKTTKTGSRGSGAAARRSAAAERAYARREERRAQREVPERSRKQRPLAERTPRLATKRVKQVQAKVATSRVPFVVAGMSVLGVGLMTTLWLSIAAVSGSYDLQRGEQRISTLTEQRDSLIRQNSAMASTPALRQRAEREGLVPGPEPAYLVQLPDGRTTVVGDPTSASAPPPPVAPPQDPPNSGVVER